MVGSWGEEGQASKGEEKGDGSEEGGGQVLPRLYFPLSFHLLTLPFLLFGGSGRKETRAPQYDPEWFGIGCGYIKKPPLPWPFGLHVAGYKYNTNKPS